MFISSEANPKGVYGCLFYKNGHKQLIFVDDFLPVRAAGDSPCFSRCKGSELWVALLEKAWAKLHGSYERICFGSKQCLTFRDLTGAPSYQFGMEEEDTF